VLNGFHELRLVDFAYVDDKGDLRLGGKPEDCERLNNGCGLFEFTKQ
jgi:hypothetical protein